MLLKFPEVVAVVVTWNPDLDILAEALCSYRSICRVVIVDNGSEQSTLARLRNNVSPSCKLIECGANFGIAVALNRGIRAGMEWGAEYYCLLDQDSIFEEGALERLVVLSRRLVLEGGGVSVVGPIPVGRDSGEAIGMYHQLSISTHSNKIREVESMYTSGMVIPSALAVDAPQAESFFIDYVDTEWCYRVRASHGAKMYVDNVARIFHRVGDSELNIPFLRRRGLLVHGPLRQYFQFRNALWMLRLPYIPLKARIVMALRCLARVGVLAVCVSPRWSRLRCVAWGGLDGLRGRSGNHAFLPEEARSKKNRIGLQKIQNGRQ